MTDKLDALDVLRVESVGNYLMLRLDEPSVIPYLAFHLEKQPRGYGKLILQIPNDLTYQISWYSVMKLIEGLEGLAKSAGVNMGTVNEEQND